MTFPPPFYNFFLFLCVNCHSISHILPLQRIELLKESSRCSLQWTATQRTCVVSLVTENPSSLQALLLISHYPILVRRDETAHSTIQRAANHCCSVTGIFKLAEISSWKDRNHKLTWNYTPAFWGGCRLEYTELQQCSSLEAEIVLPVFWGSAKETFVLINMFRGEENTPVWYYVAYMTEDAATYCEKERRLVAPCCPSVGQLDVNQVREPAGLAVLMFFPR